MNVTKDRYGRKINYLRISVTDRCNLRCIYCMPVEGVPLLSHDDILRFEEILRIAKISYQIGFRKFRITGGEPLLKRGIMFLIKNMATLADDIDLSMTTNGVLLSQFAFELRQIGLRRINISLDTLDRDKFRKITRFDLFDNVINGIESAISAGFSPIKINVVVMRGINDDEIVKFAELTLDKPLWVRFIEFMPFAKNGWTTDNFISFEEVKKRIEDHYKLTELYEYDVTSPAEYYKLDGAIGLIGFISPLTNRFCDHCNRLRLTSDGRLLPCLFSNKYIDIKEVLRSGGSDDDIKRILVDAVSTKPRGHDINIFANKFTDCEISKVGG